jgi:energy-coupling factor transporter ATP-binding protein EcfA2
MRIKSIITQGVGSLPDGEISLSNDWTGSVESKVLFTGPNGCGKSTLLRGIAMLWDALGYWLDQRKPLPQKHESREWLQRWGGFAVVLDNLEPFYSESVVILFGTLEWSKETLLGDGNVARIGETFTRGYIGKPKRELHLPKEDWLDAWSTARKKQILTYETIDAPNLVYLDAEERRWVSPKRNLSEPQPDLLSQRWLTRYLVTDDWKGQLEASLITLKTSQLHLYHEVIRSLNQFLSGKEIDPDIRPGEGRLRVKLQNQRGLYHSLDDLSAGEHQVLILIYLITRWMQKGGGVLIDEPDLYLHPSLIDPFLSALEHLVAKKDGQLLITSHAVDVWQRYDNNGLRVALESKGDA